MLALQSCWLVSQAFGPFLVTYISQRAPADRRCLFFHPFVFASSTLPKLFHFTAVDNLWHFRAWMRAGPGPQPRWLGHLSRGCWRGAQQTAPCWGLLFALGLQSSSGADADALCQACFIQPDFKAAAIISIQVSQIPYFLQGQDSLEPLVLLLPWQGHLHCVRKHRVGVVSVLFNSVLVPDSLL